MRRFYATDCWPPATNRPVISRFRDLKRVQMKTASWMRGAANVGVLKLHSGNCILTQLLVQRDLLQCLSHEFDGLVTEAACHALGVVRAGARCQPVGIEHVHISIDRQDAVAKQEV